MGQMKGDLKPLVTLKEQRKEECVYVCVCSGGCIHIYVYINVFVFTRVRFEVIL